MKQKVSIGVVSDVVCPWCYIGKRRLDKALAQLQDEFEFEVEYYPFELNPNIPAAGLPQKEYLVEKFGSLERYDALTSRVSQIAREEGIEFNYDAQHISPNTRKAQSLIQFARAAGRQQELMELLFRAYFTEGADLTKDNTLVDLAVRSGLDQDAVSKVLGDENALTQVALAEQEMYSLGITGVPFYIINKKYGISGAQSSDTFVKALQDIGKAVSSTNESCDVEAKNC